MTDAGKRLMALVICAIILLTTVPGTALAEGSAGENGRFGNVTKGDVITFGNFHGSKEWQVLEVEEDAMLVISRQALDCRPWNDTSAAVAWENCSLRSWLNSEFIEEAFTEEEQALIQTTRVINATTGRDGENTKDRVFILSLQESNRYFSSDDARRATATEYALDRGAKTGANDKCFWWLRSRGENRNKAAYVDNHGKRGYLFLSNETCCVRPVMWLSLTASETAAASDTGAKKQLKGTSGDTTWRLEMDNETKTFALYIEGAGRMADYALEGDEVNGYSSTAPWIKAIKENQLYSCLLDFSISDDVTYIGDCAFCDLWMPEDPDFTFKLPSKLESIGDYAFYDAHHIYNLTLPAKVRSVGKFAFMNSLDGMVTIPAATVEIGEGAFSGGEWRTGVKVDTQNKAYCSVGNVLFSKNMKILYCYPEVNEAMFSDAWDYDAEEVYVVPESVREIAPYAFAKSYCEGPNKIILPKGLVSIGECAFSSCMLTSIEIPEGVAMIRKNTFNDCPALKEVTLPAGLKEIEDYAFFGVDLENIYFRGTKEQWAQIEIGEDNDELLQAEIHFNVS